MEKSFPDVDGVVVAAGFSMEPTEYSALKSVLVRVTELYREGKFPLTPAEMDAIAHFNS